MQAQQHAWQKIKRIKVFLKGKYNVESTFNLLVIGMAKLWKENLIKGKTHKRLKL